MRNIVLAGVAFLGVFLVSGLGQPPPAASERTAPRTRWEYRVLTKEAITELGSKDLAAGLNKLGDEGWELATLEPGIAPHGGSNVHKQAEYTFNTTALNQLTTAAQDFL